MKKILSVVMRCVLAALLGYVFGKAACYLMYRNKPVVTQEEMPTNQHKPAVIDINYDPAKDTDARKHAAKIKIRIRVYKHIGIPKEGEYTYAYAQGGQRD